MRLSKIKLAGFKSFVDPTTITFPGNRVGIVGPNGCGKSNVIDAIRWVMGESSAKHLRGDSMADVIFNGSSSRKPVGTATIELGFDNSDGAIGGQYANYSEVSIKRIVSRDGTSQYFLNNTRCRRKDITHIFLGTGLGPRSYSIIEQGMISRLVEAKPDEMRAYIEEAAGISKYKERRRETEHRIRHTRDNLDRLNDLREEVDKQLRHLQRQARTAERYQEFKGQERMLEAELLALRLRHLDVDLRRLKQDKERAKTSLEAAVADQRRVEAEIVTARQTSDEAADAYNEANTRRYNVEGEISRLDQAIQHGRDLRKRQIQDLDQAKSELTRVSAEIEKDEARLEELDSSLSSLTPDLDRARDSSQQSAAAVESAQRALDAWQVESQEFRASLAEAERHIQVETTRLEEISRRREGLNDQQAELNRERESISLEELEDRLAASLRTEHEAEETVTRLDTQLRELDRDLEQLRQEDSTVGPQLESHRADLEVNRAQLMTQEALQEAALGQDAEQANRWLQARGLESAPRLAQTIEVSPGWGKAVETVLGDFLQSVCTDQYEGLMAHLPDTNLTLMTSVAGSRSRSPEGSLLAKVGHAGALADVLAAVRVAESLTEAVRIRAHLAPGETVVTREGLWLGHGWVRINRGDGGTAGVLAREKDIRGLQQKITTEEGVITELEARRDHARAQLEVSEQKRREVAEQAAEANRSFARAHADLADVRQAVESARSRLAALGETDEKIGLDLTSIDAQSREARQKLEESRQDLSRLEERRSEIENQQEILGAAFEGARELARQDADQLQQIAITVESRRSSLESASTTLERIQAHRRQLAGRVGGLEGQLADGAEPLDEMESDRQDKLRLKSEVDAEYSQRTRAREEAEIALRNAESGRSECTRNVEAARESADAARMHVRELEVRREGVAERFGQTGQELALVNDGLTEEATESAWEDKLESIRRKIERLGPINLAAIEEFQEQSERKTYLDAQNEDLTSALETLEKAIRKIDRETRARFQDTFDKVNKGMQRIFPRLFGGGHAYLTLEGDDLLSAGVGVMAQPPGKRNSHIHLLSGGEKALTAVSLVFAIFELNPAPFCLLDEVDAPLDEANVGRFCEIVREMSANVQFLFITHNKTTMEMANQLTGVTMNEPGCSRLVTVDIDEAVQLAAS